MGSVKNNDDLSGVIMTLYDASESTITTCGNNGAITVDGSGFYSCSANARYVELAKATLGGKITICDLTIYEEENFTT